MGVTDVLRHDRSARCPPEQRVERRAAGQPVVDHRPLGPHTAERTTGRPVPVSRFVPTRRLAIGGVLRLSSRCIGSIHQAVRRGGATVAKRVRRPRVRRPRPAAREPPARLRAAQAAQRRRSGRSGRSPTARSTPASRSCSADGLITEDTSAERCPAPAGKRSRIVYQLTAEGKEHFARTCSPRAAPPPGRTRASACTSPSSAAPTPQTRLRILEGRRSRLEERVDGFRAALARTRERLDSYTLELQRHGLESSSARCAGSPS